MKNLLLILALFVGNSFAEDGMEPIKYYGWTITNEGKAFQVSKIGKTSNKNEIVYVLQSSDCNTGELINIFYSENSEAYIKIKNTYIDARKPIPDNPIPVEANETKTRGFFSNIKDHGDEISIVFSYGVFLNYDSLSKYFEVKKHPPISLKLETDLGILKEDEWDMTGVYGALSIANGICNKNKILGRINLDKAQKKNSFSFKNIYNFFGDLFSNELDLKKHVRPYFKDALTYKYPGPQNVIYGCNMDLHNQKFEKNVRFGNAYLRTYIRHHRLSFKIAYTEGFSDELNQTYKNVLEDYQFNRHNSDDVPNLKGVILNKHHYIFSELENDFLPEIGQENFKGTSARLISPRFIREHGYIDKNGDKRIDLDMSDFYIPTLRGCFQNEIFRQFGTKTNYKKLGNFLLEYELREKPPLIDYQASLAYLDDGPHTNFEWFLVPKEQYEIYKIGFSEKLDELLANQNKISFPISSDSKFYKAYKRFYEDLCFYAGKKSNTLTGTGFEKLEMSLKKLDTSLYPDSPIGIDVNEDAEAYLTGDSIRTSSYKESGHFAGCIFTNEEIKRIAEFKAKKQKRQEAIKEMERDLKRYDSYLNSTPANTYKAPTAGEIFGNAFLQGLSNYLSPQAITNRKQLKRINSLEAQVKNQQRFQSFQQYKRYIVK